MKHGDFGIGETFWCGGRQWRCTDIGTRTVVAICIDRIRMTGNSLEITQRLGGADPAVEGWLMGPPYALAEAVFDEDDQEACQRTNEAAA